MTIDLPQNHDHNNCQGDVLGHFCNWDLRCFQCDKDFEIDRLEFVGSEIMDPITGGDDPYSTLRGLLIDNLIGKHVATCGGKK